MKLLMRLFSRFSVRGLVLLSVGVTLLPFLVGLVSAVLTVDRLAGLSQQAIRDVAGQTRLSLDLLDRLNDLERKGREYLSFRDGASFREYRLSHDQFDVRLRAAADAALSEGRRLADGLESLAKDEKDIFDAIISRFPPQPDKPSKTSARLATASREETQPLADRLQSVKARVREMSQEYIVLADQKARNLEAVSLDVKRQLIVDIAMLLPISGVLLAVFIYLLHNPVRQIDHVIRALGGGNFTQPVRIVGPGDVEFLGERLEWLRTRLNDLEMAKQRFVRNVSHEIKTPLASIHEGTELLLDEVVGELNREQKDIAHILISNADRLDRLIAELINYSQVSAHREYQKFSPVDMRFLVLAVLEDLQLQFRGKSISVLESLEPLTLMGNAEQLRTIVENLLSNAIKYSPPSGEIRLSLRKDGGHMELEVEDEGPGIDPDERGRVFEPFFQGRAARALGVKGTGFGLAIVAECVANHHGKVEVLQSREDDAGARIRVQIPMQSFG